MTAAEEALFEFEEAQGIRNMFPEVLTPDQCAEIVAALPENPSRPDMVALALVRHSHREANESEIKLYWDWHVKRVGLAAARYDRDRGEDAECNMEGILFGTLIGQVLTSSLTPDQQDEVVFNMVKAWKGSVKSEAWQKQKMGLQKFLNIKRESFAKHKLSETMREIAVLEKTLNAQEAVEESQRAVWWSEGWQRLADIVLGREYGEDTLRLRPMADRIFARTMAAHDRHEKTHKHE